MNICGECNGRRQLETGEVCGFCFGVGHVPDIGDVELDISELSEEQRNILKSTLENRSMICAMAGNTLIVDIDCDGLPHRDLSSNEIDECFEEISQQATSPEEEERMRNGFKGTRTGFQKDERSEIAGEKIYYDKLEEIRQEYLMKNLKPEKEAEIKALIKHISKS